MIEYKLIKLRSSIYNKLKKKKRKKESFSDCIDRLLRAK